MSRSTQSPVPRLDLAPKLKRPLSLWNPLDYLRLLYWVFYFPQALRWYVDRYGGDADVFASWQERWQWLQQNPVHFQLWLQGLVLMIATSLLFYKLLEILGIDISWPSVIFGVTISVLASWWVALDIDLTTSLVFGHFANALFMCFFYIGVNDLNWEASILAYALLSIISPTYLNLDENGVSIQRVTPFISLGLIAGFTSLIIELFYKSNVTEITVLSTVVCLLFLRLEAWLISLPLWLFQLTNQIGFVARVTYIPIPTLSFRLGQWLQQDWEAGLYNIDQLLTYTLQFIPVIRAVNRVLARTHPEHLLPYLTQLAADPLDWQLIRFASADLGAAIQSNAIDGIFFIPERWKQQFKNRLNTSPRLDTPAKAAAAGFWYLYLESPAEATRAFREVRNLPRGEEMYQLAATLDQCLEAETLTAIAAVQIDPPPAEPLLRPTTWNAIGNFQRVVSDVQVVQQSVSRVARSFALNRAIGELTTLLNNISEIPKAEQELISRIAKTWEATLQNAASEVGAIVIDQPITNPYVVGDPVVGNLFVGRDDILKRLEELWFVSPQLQSVVLYGHRRMGKTSILRNMEHRLGNGVKIAYVNFLKLGNVAQGVAEVLMAMGDAIAEIVNLSAPADADLLNLPYRTFERFIKQVEKSLEQKRLIVALDEFEKIEHLIQTGQISQDFWEYLRGLVQQSPKIALAFAGLHTLDETIGDYQHPFFASVIPIPVRFLDLGSTQLLLEAPSDEFPLTYAPKVLHQIYDLTAGQPYLVQLIGFQLVRRYNNQVFNQGRTRDPQLNTDDLTAIIQDPEFFNQGRYYFTGVWGQANQDAPGQQAILRALAPHPQGLDLAELIQITGLTETQLTPALATLKKHDVIQQTENKWQIIVELFRRWVIDHT